MCGPEIPAGHPHRLPRQQRLALIPRGRPGGFQESSKGSDANFMTGPHGPTSTKEQPWTEFHDLRIFPVRREVCETRNCTGSTDPIGVWRIGYGRSGVGSRYRPRLYVWPISMVPRARLAE